jgi:hypothetical protein
MMAVEILIGQRVERQLCSSVNLSVAIMPALSVTGMLKIL